MDLDSLLQDDLTFNLDNLFNEWDPEDPQRAPGQSLAQTILTTINLGIGSLSSNKRALLHHHVVYVIQTFSSLLGPTGANDSPLCMSSDP